MGGVLTLNNPVRQFTELSSWEKLIDIVSPIPKWNVFEGNIENQEHLKVYIEIMTTMILGTKNYFYGVAGEFCSLVWSQSEIINALENTKAKEICFICGPKFDISNIGFMKLLAKDKRIKLLYVKKRQPQHFRITDKSLMIEAHHENFAAERKAVYCLNKSIANYEYYHKFIDSINQLKTDGILEKVDACEILMKFKIEIYDENEVERHRGPKESEIKSAFQALYDRIPEDKEIKEIQAVQSNISIN
ncbi:MAG: hypothetical protein KAT05_16470 [Spirochaetes bacterium]|nr:hypothetical protein [Spirochaetota bacterium]